MAADNTFPREPGIHDLILATTAGPVEVSIAVPESATVNAPLVTVLHYAGTPTTYYGRPLVEHLVQPALANLNAVIFAPTSLGGDWKTTENIKAVFELVEQFEHRYQTDPQRRVLTGYSMGAIGTWRLQAARPTYFSAAIPIAGFSAITPEDCKTPIFVLLSDVDEIFDLKKFEIDYHQLRANDCDVEMRVVAGVGHYDIGGYKQALETTTQWLSEIWNR